MSKIKLWCGREFLKARWSIEGIPCDTDEEFERALESFQNVRRVWDGDNCFYEIFEIFVDIQGWEGDYCEIWVDETNMCRYVNFKLPDTPSKPKQPKQPIPFWANDWRKKYKRR